MNDKLLVYLLQAQNVYWAPFNTSCKCQRRECPRECEILTQVHSCCAMEGILQHNRNGSALAQFKLLILQTINPSSKKPGAKESSNSLIPAQIPQWPLGIHSHCYCTSNSATDLCWHCRWELQQQSQSLTNSGN